MCELSAIRGLGTILIKIKYLTAILKSFSYDEDIEGCCEIPPTKSILSTSSRFLSTIIGNHKKEKLNTYDNERPILLSFNEINTVEPLIWTEAYLV